VYDIGRGEKRCVRGGGRVVLPVSEIFKGVAIETNQALWKAKEIAEGKNTGRKRLCGSLLGFGQVYLFFKILARENEEE